MSDEPLVFAVDEGGRIGYAPTQRPPSAPAPVRSKSSKAQEEYDLLRRPQAGKLFRALREAGESGMSWRGCWALGEGNERWDVGPIVIWLRMQKVQIDARYDPVGGETRFYLLVGNP